MRKFGRVKKQRVALLKGLAGSLVKYGKIITTEAKAKELRPFVEKLITRGKSGTLASRRILVSRVGNTVSKKIIDEIALKYQKRVGGYTRIVKLSARKSDGSKMAVIEFV